MQFLFKKGYLHLPPASPACALARAGSPCGAMRHPISPSIPVNNVVPRAGAVVTELKAIHNANGLQYLSKSPATLFVWALWTSLACNAGLCPQVNSRIVIFPELSLLF